MLGLCITVDDNLTQPTSDVNQQPESGAVLLYSMRVQADCPRAHRKWSPDSHLEVVSYSFYWTTPN